MKNLNLYTWNVNGIRAQEKKGFIEWVKNTQADIIAVQETKAHPEQLSENLKNIEKYQSYWNSGEKKGYSGVGIYSKITPLKIITDFQNEILNKEGRLIGMEFEKFYFFNGYFPNGGRGIDYVHYKIAFYKAFYDYIERLTKPVIFCGDINTAHMEIDLSHPDQNKNSSGFMDIEREWLHFITDKGYIDAFRFFDNSKNKYTWWDLRTRSREKNIGWRIDYFFVSKELKNNLVNCKIHEDTMGSDHAPVSLNISI